MIKIIVFLILISLGCSSNKETELKTISSKNSKTKQKLEENQSEEWIKISFNKFNESQLEAEFEIIKDLLLNQQKDWNNGNIEGFMQGYWKSDKLIFASAKHKPTYGWEKTLKRYRESYPTKKSMGKLNFVIHNMKLVSNTDVNVSGNWELVRDDDNPKGWFQLTLNKFQQGWFITKDFTINYE